MESFHVKWAEFGTRGFNEKRAIFGQKLPPWPFYIPRNWCVLFYEPMGYCFMVFEDHLWIFSAKSSVALVRQVHHKRKMRNFQVKTTPWTFYISRNRGVPFFEPMGYCFIVFRNHLWIFSAKSSVALVRQVHHKRKICNFRAKTTPMDILYLSQ